MIKSIKKLLTFFLWVIRVLVEFHKIKHTFVCIAYVQAKKLMVNSL